MQVGEQALQDAARLGFRPHNRGEGELAIAFRPDFIATYIENLEALHGCGQSPRETEILDDVGRLEENGDTSETQEVAEERRFAVISARRALRDLKFRDRVLTVYHSACAMCGVQLRLVEAAHILPAVHRDSTDQTTNGVALCSLHHRAYDRGFITFGPDYRVRINETMVADLRNQALDAKLRTFQTNLRPFIALPPDDRDHPNVVFVKAANALRGWPN